MLHSASGSATRTAAHSASIRGHGGYADWPRRHVDRGGAVTAVTAVRCRRTSVAPELVVTKHSKENDDTHLRKQGAGGVGAGRGSGNGGGHNSADVDSAGVDSR
jgi:hypothetical protein